MIVVAVIGARTFAGWSSLESDVVHTQEPTAYDEASEHLWPGILRVKRESILDEAVMGYGSPVGRVRVSASVSADVRGSDRVSADMAPAT